MTFLTKLSTLCAILIFMIGCSSPSKVSNEETDTAERSIDEAPSFEYDATKPVNGELFGSVILGSSGFDAFIVEIDSAKNWQLVEAQYGVSNVYENEADEMSVRIGLKNYLNSMLEKEVPGENIHFIISSSAKENEKVKLIKPVLQELGYVINEVDEDLEARCALYATIPPVFREEAFVIDIGSGNTKLSWIYNDEVNTVSTYGSKYNQDNVADSTVYSEVVKSALSIPEANVSKAFLIGGAAFQLAKTTREGDERYTTLNAPSEYTGIDDQKTLNGLNIYEAISFSTKCEYYIFDWHSNFAIGFLLLLD